MRKLLFLLCAFAALSAMSQNTATLSSARKQCIDSDWQFHYGELTSLPTDQQTSAWRTLDLPHDWSVETDAAKACGGKVIGPFSDKSVGTTQTGWTVGGEGWYKKSFTLSSKQRDRLVSIYFEGVYNHSTVYINGKEVHFNPYGYTSYRVDLTPYLKPAGEPNTLLVKVENKGVNSRWYAGSGIFRHVWIISTPKTHLDRWETIVSTDNDKLIASNWSSAQVNVKTTVKNAQSLSAQGRLKVTILSPKGKKVATQSVPFSVDSNGDQTLSLSLPVAAPQLWSPSSPSLYHAIIETSTSAVGKDRLDIPFGIRSLSFSAKEGFLLNGKPTLIQGGCVHHDNGLLGAAAYDKAELRKISLLKAQGFNALRGSHNMQSENFFNICDSLGMMVLDECFDQWYFKKNTDDYSQYFAERHAEDLQVMLRRDINHPSIIIWGIGNEIPGRIEDKGKAVAKEMHDIIRQYDTVRPVTAAICGWDEGDEWNSNKHSWDIQDAEAFESLDLGGYNYMFSAYEHDHGTHPDRVICGLESFPKCCSENWNLVEKYPYVIGDFVWTAMDYLGEAGIGSSKFDERNTMFRQWPWFNGWCGDIDLIGQRKPQSYYRDVVWHRAPVTMAVEQPYNHEDISAWGWQQEHQSWTWPQYNVESKMNVNVYSRAEKVRLYLNGRLIGEKVPTTTYWAGFNCGYEPGELKAVNVEGGKETDSFVLTTTGTPASVRLTADRSDYKCDGTDLIYVTAELIDSDGRVITSDSTEKVSFSLEGEGTLLACGNASPTDMESFRNPSPTLFEGRALAIIRTTKHADAITLRCQGTSVGSSSITVRTSK